MRMGNFDGENPKINLGYKGQLTKQPFQMTKSEYFGSWSIAGKSYKEQLEEITAPNRDKADNTGRKVGLQGEYNDNRSY